MTGEVGRLHREKQIIENQISDLFAFYSKHKQETVNRSSKIIYYSKYFTISFFSRCNRAGQISRPLTLHQTSNVALSIYRGHLTIDLFLILEDLDHPATPSLLCDYALN